MHFTSERLVFRELREEDFHLFYSVFSNEQVMKYALMDRVATEEELRPYFDQILKNNQTFENREGYEYAVLSAIDGSFIGVADIMILLQNMRPTGGEIGYFLLPAFWGKGYATEIASKLTEICFSNLKLHRVVARCNANNLQSEKIMKKVGMKKEGELRKARFKDGRWDNELHYSILAEEWKQR
ncbi:MAG: GNAT family N-acetyltransferase [Clostridia bacterium]|nr:GNAT family N-acetyltransferase [Clostridia bacterium]